jgi:hypothetical protein
MVKSNDFLVYHIGIDVVKSSFNFVISHVIFISFHEANGMAGAGVKRMQLVLIQVLVRPTLNEIGWKRADFS